MIYEMFKPGFPAKTEEHAVLAAVVFESRLSVLDLNGLERVDFSFSPRVLRMKLRSRIEQWLRL